MRAIILQGSSNFGNLGLKWTFRTFSVLKMIIMVLAQANPITSSGVNQDVREDPELDKIGLK